MTIETSAGEKSSTIHIPVLPSEVLELGMPRPTHTWVDGTAGGGGHSRLIADAIGREGRLLALDRDPSVAAHLRSALPEQAVIVSGSYDQTAHHLAELGWDSTDGILLDLGLSSDQLADRERGFSFQGDGILDMHFDPTCGEPAWEWLQRVDEKTLADTIYQYGEERFSRRIARRIVETRGSDKLRHTGHLRELIYGCIPKARRTKGGARRHGHVDPATRTFQALRIAVNDELSILERALQCLPDCLAPGGVLLVISFHSLEDRLVKRAFRGDQRLEIVTKRPVQATSEEVSRNPRARSAKLRAARRKLST